MEALAEAEALEVVGAEVLVEAGVEVLVEAEVSVEALADFVQPAVRTVVGTLHLALFQRFESRIQTFVRC